jgi:Zn-dependent protease with chaperone function
MKAITARLEVIVLAVALCATSVPLAAQTEIKLPKNKYSPKQDVELGKEAAAEVRKQYPIISDEVIASYLTKLGDRLVAAAPPNLKEPVYEYSFTPVNVKEINAFALPGGPMFVNRGMFEAAAAEGEVVGVMAHELSHVLLRHGTANATKAQNPWLQLGQIAGVVGGAVVGGAAGSAIMQGSQLGLGSVLLRYSRDFEKQADLLGAQIMARAGYDPRDLAHMFETIEKESQGGGTPQWLSSHPNPGNRTVYITKEAEKLTIATPADTGGFSAIKPRLAALPKAKSMAEVERDAANGREGGSGGGEGARSVGTPGQPVPAPSAEYRDVKGGNVFRATVPANWTSLSSSSSVRAIPENGYGELKGQTVFTHGVEFGITKTSSRDLRDATTLWLRGLREGNPEMRLVGEPQSFRMAQRSAMATTLTNPSPLGGAERITISTTFLADGVLFYYLSVAPEHDLAGFQDAFNRVRQSIQLASR